SVFEVDDSWSELQPLSIPSRNDLWRKRLSRFPPLLVSQITQWPKSLAAQEPKAIDVVQARYGETVRYLGLPFARVRRLMGSERVWFGVDGSSRTLLDDQNIDQLNCLVEDLRQHRSADAVDLRHALYRNASEAWLESI